MTIFSKSIQRVQKVEQTAASPAPAVKYLKPKILLLDLPEVAADVLAQKGFNISSGTLGKPYKVLKSDKYLPLIGKHELPNYTEQEIVVVDLSYDQLAEEPDGEKPRPNSEPDLWAKCDMGYIDPRPRTVAMIQGAFDRIQKSGGVFVVFADAKVGVEIQIACWNGGLNIKQQFEYNEWDIISELSYVDVYGDHGEEMSVCDIASPLGRLINDHLNGGKFFCTIHYPYREIDPWAPLVVNKFGNAVGMCRYRDQLISVIVLPQLADKAGFLVKLFTNVLPELAPHLFPEIERGRWTNRDEYELPRILELKAKQIEVKQHAKAKVAALERDINQERDANGWIHDLLTGTDAQLVEAVKKALTFLGFSKIIDVDEERDREGKSRREDLQITDQSPTLILDIKGIAGYPSDEDALQADKHAAIRMREWKKTDVEGLSIINHQRHMPPLERENTMPFRQELIDAALERTLGLMTTWDLYRLVRNVQKHGWRSNVVKALFYKKGRIEAVPEHYQYIGKVAKAWTDKFGVVLAHGELRMGDQIGIEFPIEFEEVDVESIQVDGQNIEEAKVNDRAGLLWPAGRPKIREGMRVFRIY